MSTQLSSLPPTSIAPLARPRKRTRTLLRVALGLVTVATAGLFPAAHATYPGENGVIVFENSNAPFEDTTVVKRVSPGSSTITTLTKGYAPSVSPNGKKIAFLKARSLYVMNIDGSNVVLLDDNEISFSPVWVPDGSKVIYAIPTGDLKLPAKLWSINPDGTGKTFVRNLVLDETVYKGLDLAWSPAGNIYTFNDDHGGLSISDNVNPGTIRKLATDGHGSSWAPDGASILFNDSLHNQFEINPDGSNRRSVPPAGVTNDTSAISPDAAFIAGGIYNEQLLVTRARAGTPTTFSWATGTGKTDWSRVPKNCYVSTPQGGGEVLAGDVDFYAEQCAITVMPDGGLNGVLQQAIAVGPDQRLYHRVLKTNPFGGTPTWTSFARVPGAGGNPNGINAKKIAIAASKDGSAQIVIINANDNVVYHAMRYTNGSWSGFTALDGFAGASNFAARDVAIAINASTPTSPGNAQVIANGLEDGDVFHRVRWAAGNWTPFANIPAIDNGGNTYALAITAGEDGYTDIAATSQYPGDPGMLQHITRNPDSSWGGFWRSVYKPSGTPISASSDVALTRTLSGMFQLLFTDSNGNTFLQEFPDRDFVSPVPTTRIANAVGRAVSISAGTTPNSSSQLLITRTFPQ